MARKFFNQRINNTRRTVTQIIIIVVIVIGVISAFFIINAFRNKNNGDVIIELKDNITIEINSSLPEKTTFFSKLENVDEKDIEISYKSVDVSKAGSYQVALKINNKKYESTLNVVDTISPELALKNYSISSEGSYKASDFVEKCTDNSKEECKIEFYGLATNQNGEKIDYSKYSTPGNYTVQIIASDSSNNSTIKDATLTIGKPNIPIQTTCKFGGNDYDQNLYILAVDVTENGCALNLNYYQDSNVLAAANSIMDQETEKLKKEFSKLNTDGTIVLNRKATAILNKEGKGIVGYTIHMDLIVNKNGNEELVESYYLDKAGKRIYSVNKYNLT